MKKINLTKKEKMTLGVLSIVFILFASAFTYYFTQLKPNKQKEVEIVLVDENGRELSSDEVKKIEEEKKTLEDKLANASTEEQKEEIKKQIEEKTKQVEEKQQVVANNSTTQVSPTENKTNTVQQTQKTESKQVVNNQNTTVEKKTEQQKKEENKQETQPVNPPIKSDVPEKKEEPKEEVDSFWMEGKEIYVGVIGRMLTDSEKAALSNYINTVPRRHWNMVKAVIISNTWMASDDGRVFVPLKYLTSGGTHKGWYQEIGHIVAFKTGFETDPKAIQLLEKYRSIFNKGATDNTGDMFSHIYEALMGGHKDSYYQPEVVEYVKWWMDNH